MRRALKGASRCCKKATSLLQVGQHRYKCGGSAVSATSNIISNSRGEMQGSARHAGLDQVCAAVCFCSALVCTSVSGAPACLLCALLCQLRLPACYAVHSCALLCPLRLLVLPRPLHASHLLTALELLTSLKLLFHDGRCLTV